MCGIYGIWLFRLKKSPRSVRIFLAMLTSITLLAAGAHGLLIQAGASSGATMIAPRPALSPRAGPISAAYNPQPSKAKPRKVKSKDPKQKTKGPADPAAAMQLVPEQIFSEGPPSITETFIPGLSLITVVGVIPFAASLARQAWTRYKITNKRMEVCSGFQGKDVVQVTWREVQDIKWLRRYGGKCGDMVPTLSDGVKFEVLFYYLFFPYVRKKRPHFAHISPTLLLPIGALAFGIRPQPQVHL